ncbi:UDP-glucose:undecaprenyl-phosphate glucose-1-phosphate transferase [Abditibacteriota bacterium]|nr:UDP-glucose:undecaprenyl-phosphate glucose-1-phosphate transferase [Abditibacteriota bacterium]
MSLEPINLSASLSGTTTATSTQEVPSVGTSDLVKPSRPEVGAVAYHGSKRATDIILCVGGLVVFWPVMGAIALAIKIDSRGPVLFRQSRPGLDGKPFNCLKFRTMIADAEALLQDHPELINEFSQNGKIRHDPRVTRMGHFLRKTSLDELPQILNILYGQMTLVGPRPIVWSQEEQYGEYLSKLYSVKPGLAGLWQVEGRSETTMEERIALDMKYVDSRSLRGDMKLLLRTLRAVIQRKGAY